MISYQRMGAIRSCDGLSKEHAVPIEELLKEPVAKTVAGSAAKKKNYVNAAYFSRRFHAFAFLAASGVAACYPACDPNS